MPRLHFDGFGLGDRQLDGQVIQGHVLEAAPMLRGEFVSGFLVGGVLPQAMPKSE